MDEADTVLVYHPFVLLCPTIPPTPIPFHTKNDPQALNKAFQMSCGVLAEEHKALGEQEQENTRIVNK